MLKKDEIYEYGHILNNALLPYGAFIYRGENDKIEPILGGIDKVVIKNTINLYCRNHIFACVSKFKETGDKFYKGVCDKGREYFICQRENVADKLYYVINSHVHNIPIAKKKIKQLIKLGIKSDKIILALGKAHRDDLDKNIFSQNDFPNGIRTIIPSISAWEYSAMYELSINPLTSSENYFFICQDTMDFGPRFNHFSKSANIFLKPDIIPIGPRWEMNGSFGTWHSLGVYSSKFLRKISNHLKELDGMTRTEGIYFERNFQSKGITSMADLIYFYPETCEVDEGGPVKYYGTKKLFRYFPRIDIKKYFTEGDGANTPLKL